jgi:P27 family predicted phage terminase small subunit
MKDYSKIREAFTKHLEGRGDYDEPVDQLTIDLLVANLEIAERCQEAILRDGPTVEGRFGIVQHPSYNVYSSSIKNCAMLLTKLGINRQERRKLKIAEEESKDLFDATFAALRN